MSAAVGDEIVRATRSGAVAVLTLGNPPVNAPGFAVRDALAAELRRAHDDAGVAAVAIACAGRTFSAGADIAELGRPVRRPSLRDVIELPEGIAEPKVAARHGTALGGGFELAPACHFRVAEAPAKTGLPEVKRGLPSGGGGTVRLDHWRPRRGMRDLRRHCFREKALARRSQRRLAAA